MHYMPMIALSTPHSFHTWFNRLRGRANVDTFRTVYRANTKAKIAAIAKDVGMVPGTFVLLESRPEYLRISALTYLGGILYERLVNNVPGLASFRIVLIGELLRPA